VLLTGIFKHQPLVRRVQPRAIGRPVGDLPQRSHRSHRGREATRPVEISVDWASDTEVAEGIVYSRFQGIIMIAPNDSHRSPLGASMATAINYFAFSFVLIYFI